MEVELSKLLRTKSQMASSPDTKLKRYKDNPHQLERGIRKACKKKRADLELKIENSRIRAEEAEKDWFIGFDDLQKLRDIGEECNKYRNVLDTPLGDKGDETKAEGRRRTRRRGRRRGRGTRGRRRGRGTRGRRRGRGTRGRRRGRGTRGRKRGRGTRGRKRGRGTRGKRRR